MGKKLPPRVMGVQVQATGICQILFIGAIPRFFIRFRETTFDIESFILLYVCLRFDEMIVPKGADRLVIILVCL